MILPLLLGCSNATAPADDTWRPDTGPSTVDTDTAAEEASVVLNEVLADNKAGAISELGEHEDWLELLNVGSEPVDITGWSLSDDAEEPWVIDTPHTLAPGQFLLIWCDEEDDDALADLHADFKLSRGGETILLQDDLGEPVDSVTYPELTPDQSWGRAPDGAMGWDYTAEPTPGANNL